jgi:hypothetical protein
VNVAGQISRDMDMVAAVVEVLSVVSVLPRGPPENPSSAPAILARWLATQPPSNPTHTVEPPPARAWEHREPDLASPSDSRSPDRALAAALSPASASFAASMSATSSAAAVPASHGSPLGTPSHGSQMGTSSPPSSVASTSASSHTPAETGADVTTSPPAASTVLHHTSEDAASHAVGLAASSEGPVSHGQRALGHSANPAPSSSAAAGPSHQQPARERTAPVHDAVKGASVGVRVAADEGTAVRDVSGSAVQGPEAVHAGEAVQEQAGRHAPAEPGAENMNARRSRAPEEDDKELVVAVSPRSDPRWKKAAVQQPGEATNQAQMDHRSESEAGAGKSAGGSRGQAQAGQRGPGEGGAGNTAGESRDQAKTGGRSPSRAGAGENTHGPSGGADGDDDEELFTVVYPKSDPRWKKDQGKRKGGGAGIPGGMSREDLYRQIADAEAARNLGQVGRRSMSIRNKCVYVCMCACGDVRTPQGRGHVHACMCAPVCAHLRACTAMCVCLPV